MEYEKGEEEEEEGIEVGKWEAKRGPNFRPSCFLSSRSLPSNTGLPPSLPPSSLSLRSIGSLGDSLERRVSVAEGNDGNVDVRGLLDGLVVRPRVGHDNQAGLPKGLGDVVGESSGGETTGNGGGTSVLGEFEHGALAVRAGRDDGHVCGVFDGGNDAGSEDNLFPGLLEVDDVDAVRSALVDVRRHLVAGVLVANVRLGSEEHRDVLGGRYNGGAISHQVGGKGKNLDNQNHIEYFQLKVEIPTLENRGKLGRGHGWFFGSR